MIDLGVLFVCRWGDIRLIATAIEWTAGNTLVAHDPASGSKHVVQPRGNQLRRAKVTLSFDEFPEQPDPIGTFRRLEAAVAANPAERALFWHPMDGSFMALVGDFSPKIDESTIVSAEIEFVPDEEFAPVTPASAGTSSVSGEGLVAATAAKLNKELEPRGLAFKEALAKEIDFRLPVDLSIKFAVKARVAGDVTLSGGASSSATAQVSAAASADASVTAFASAYARAAATAQLSAVVDATGSASADAFAFSYASAALTSDAQASVASWSDEGTTARKVLNDAARLSAGISAMIDLGRLEHDLQLFPVFKAAILFGDSIRRAAIAATSDSSSTGTMIVETPTALLPLAARIYGGRLATQRARQIAQLNEIGTPGWLAPGTYLIPARPPSARSTAFGV